MPKIVAVDVVVLIWRVTHKRLVMGRRVTTRALRSGWQIRERVLPIFQRYHSSRVRSADCCIAGEAAERRVCALRSPSLPGLTLFSRFRDHGEFDKHQAPQQCERSANQEQKRFAPKTESFRSSRHQQTEQSRVVFKRANNRRGPRADATLITTPTDRRFDKVVNFIKLRRRRIVRVADGQTASAALSFSAAPPTTQGAAATAAENEEAKHAVEDQDEQAEHQRNKIARCELATRVADNQGFVVGGASIARRYTRSSSAHDVRDDPAKSQHKMRKIEHWCSDSPRPRLGESATHNKRYDSHRK